MQQLSTQERNAMLALWKTGNGSPSQILEHHRSPKPHKNSLNSTLKNLESKGLVSHQVIGNSYDYYPMITKERFRELYLENFVKDFFEHSYKELALFFATKRKISEEEFKDLLQIIKEKKQK